MTFKRNGALDRFTYGWFETPESKKKAERKNVNICSLFWMTVASFFIVWPFIGITRFLGWVLRIVGAIPAIILFGYRPTGSSWRFVTPNQQNPLPFVPIKWWPGWEGDHIMPIVPVMVAAFVALVCYLVFYVVIWQLIIQGFFVGVVFETAEGTVSFWSILTIAVLAVIYAIVRNTEPWQMFKGYAKALKERVCPIVTFE